MQRHPLIGTTIAASLIAASNLASAQTWPSTDEAGRPARGSYSGAPAGEGPGAQGSQGLVLRGDGAGLPDNDVAGVIVVVPPPRPTTTLIVPVVPSDPNAAPSSGTPSTPSSGGTTQ